MLVWFVNVLNPIRSPFPGFNRNLRTPVEARKLHDEGRAFLKSYWALSIINVQHKKHVFLIKPKYHDLGCSRVFNVNNVPGALTGFLHDQPWSCVRPNLDREAMIHLCHDVLRFRALCFLRDAGYICNHGWCVGSPLLFSCWVFRGITRIFKKHCKIAIKRCPAPKIIFGVYVGTFVFLVAGGKANFIWRSLFIHGVYWNRHHWDINLCLIMNDNSLAG